MDGLCGLTATAARTRLVTVRLADPVTPPRVALMIVLPLPVVAVLPFVPGELLTVATLAIDELQCTELVRSCDDPSVNVPTAVNSCLNPKGIATTAGLTVMDTMDAGETVTVPDPVTPPRVALMIAAPVAREVARPLELTLATP